MRAVTRAAKAGASLAPASRMAWTRRGASASMSGISAVSGRFFQYFSGISDRMAWVLMRAGLKILAK